MQMWSIMRANMTCKCASEEQLNNLNSRQRYQKSSCL